MKRIPQLEIEWDEPEPFALVPQQTTDGDRIAAEQLKRESDRAESAKQQEKFQIVP